MEFTDSLDRHDSVQDLRVRQCDKIGVNENPPLF